LGKLAKSRVGQVGEKKVSTELFENARWGFYSEKSAELRNVCTVTIFGD